MKIWFFIKFPNFYLVPSKVVITKKNFPTISYSPSRNFLDPHLCKVKYQYWLYVANCGFYYFFLIIFFFWNFYFLSEIDEKCPIRWTILTQFPISILILRVGHVILSICAILGRFCIKMGLLLEQKLIKKTGIIEKPRFLKKCQRKLPKIAKNRKI